MASRSSCGNAQKFGGVRGAARDGPTVPIWFAGLARATAELDAMVAVSDGVMGWRLLVVAVRRGVWVLRLLLGVDNRFWSGVGEQRGEAGATNAEVVAWSDYAGVVNEREQLGATGVSPYSSKQPRPPS